MNSPIRAGARRARGSSPFGREHTNRCKSNGRSECWRQGAGRGCPRWYQLAGAVIGGGGMTGRCSSATPCRIGQSGDHRPAVVDQLPRVSRRPTSSAICGSARRCAGHVGAGALTALPQRQQRPTSSAETRSRARRMKVALVVAIAIAPRPAGVSRPMPVADHLRREALCLAVDQCWRAPIILPASRNAAAGRCSPR